MNYRVLAVCALILTGTLVAKAQKQDAAALEDQYKLCSQHYIPADKCTDDIYKQLKAKRDELLDPKTKAALAVFKSGRTMYLDPKSVHLVQALVTDTMGVCIRVSAKNGLGGVINSEFAAPGTEKKGRGGITMGFNGADPWNGVCRKGSWSWKWLPYTNVTDKVNQALKETD